MEVRLDIFYNEPPEFDDIIKEIPMDKIDIIINQVSIIIEESKSKKNYVFNIDNIKVLIGTSVELILSNLEEINIL